MTTNVNFRCFLFAIGFASLINVGRSEEFIVENGRPNAEIIVAEGSTRAARLGAQELQRYLMKLTGAKLAIRNAPGRERVRIFVGRSTHTDKLGIDTKGLDHGAYRIVSGKDWLALIGDDADFEPHALHARNIADRARVRAEWDRLTGGRWDLPIDKTDRWRHPETGWWQDDRRGSLNAVYDFLRGLGVSWFMPGELGEVVPKMDSIRLQPQSFNGKPKATAAGRALLPVNKKPAVTGRSARVTSNVDASGLPLNEFLFDRTVRPDFAMRHHDCNRWDLISRDEILWHFRLGLNWGGEHLGLGRRHAMQAVLAREEMKREHPDYYAIWGGKRQTDYIGDGAPCLSSEGFFKEHVRYVRAVLDTFDEPMVDIGFPDNMGKTGKTCECERCVAQYNLKRPFGGLSDYVWGYSNRVAEEVAKTHPDKLVFGYAYQNAFLPPENIERLHPNLAVVMATVWRHRRQYLELHNPAKRDVDAVRRAWGKKVSSGVVYNWEYYLFPRLKTDGWHAAPVYFPHAIVDDLRALKAIPGMRVEYVEVTRNDPKVSLPQTSTSWGTRGELYAPGFAHLNVYLTARLYWDVEQDVDGLLTDYCQKFYGPASKEMKAFIEFCEQNWPKLWPSNPDAETLRQMQQLLAEARAKAGDESNYARRIELISEYTKPLTLRP